MQKHLAIFSPKVITAILSGKKTIDGRFSKNRISPFLTVQAGDVVYIKAPGEDINAQFRVKKVLFFEAFEKEDFDEIVAKYWNKIGWGDEKDEQKFKKEKKESSHYATLIWIDEVEQFIVPPVRIRKSDNRAWVVLKE
jgi:hypothetical protein